MARRKSKPTAIIDEITRIRQRLESINELQHRNIRDQLELALCKMMEHLNEKPKYLYQYISELRALSKDDVGLGLLDTLHDQVRNVNSDFNKVLEDVEHDESTSDLRIIDSLLKRINELTNLVKRLQRIEEVINTHIGEPVAEDN